MDEESGVARSTLPGLKEKLQLLWPYMWPKKDILLQCRVLLCIACLVAGRVVNPYVPLCYRNIGKLPFALVCVLEKTRRTSKIKLSIHY